MSPFRIGFMLALPTLMLACARRPTGPPDAGAAAVASRLAVASSSSPRHHAVTLADRGRWFERLRWSSDCEDAFVHTRLTDDAGLNFHDLPAGTSLLVVRCAPGAYQPTSIVLLLDQRTERPAASALEFPTFESLDGQTLAPARVTELTGEIAVLDGGATLTVLTVARQLGDCGTWARYALGSGQPVLEAFAERVSCPPEPGERAEPKPGEPPRGWHPVAIN